jgi:hypothetical protein
VGEYAAFAMWFMLGMAAGMLFSVWMLRQAVKEEEERGGLLGRGGIDE